MYVRKFEADSLEEALKNIKRELGPDAIILKTITNKGLKGAFKKSKIEITAAISEKNYSKKAKVDNVLDSSQKEQFYQNNSSYISNMLNAGGEADSGQAPSGYGKLGLNKAVTSTTVPSQAIGRPNLDDFLNSPARKTNQNEAAQVSQSSEVSFDDFLLEEPTVEERSQEKVQLSQSFEDTNLEVERSNLNSDLGRVVDIQKSKIDELEKKIFELSQSVNSMSKPESVGIQDLMTTLRSLDIDEAYIQQLIRKSHFELNEEEKEIPDSVFEYALREMLGELNVQMPLFSSIDTSEKNSVTVVISDVTCGQSTVLRKIASLQKDSVIVKNKGSNEFKENETFAEKFFDIEMKVGESISEIVSHTRTTLENKKNVFIDYKAANQEVNEIKKFIDGLRRSFENVEVLVCLSSINSELYNKKVLNRYINLANGIVVTHLDQCLNYGALFNLGMKFNSIPYKFFGTGEVVPDDLEAATAERILAGIFQL